MPRKNVCTIIGHVGGDAETKAAGGTPLVTWSVGVSAFKRDGETQWFRCAWWGDRAVKVAAYIRKGDCIDVTGEVSARAWLPPGSDEPRVSLEIRVSDVTLLGGKRDDAPAPAPRKPVPQRRIPGVHEGDTYPGSFGSTADPPDDDMPF